jgi:NH3-dependent NAD+ synthetase
MLGAVDIKIFGVVGILILLLIGYFVYLLYQDLVFLKKEITEIKTIPQIQDNNSWHHHQEEDEDSAGLNEEEQDAELERHLASFMNQHPVRENTPEPELKMEEIETKEVKKRTYKKKKNIVVEDDPDEITVDPIEV